MSCAPDQPITWDAIHGLATRVDALTRRLGYPGATYLMDRTDMPFSLPSTQDFSGAIRFAVLFGTDTVQTQHLTSGVTSLDKYELSPVLQGLADAGDLFLKVEADGCICSTLFKVESDASLSEVLGTGLGCCQRLYVPQPGDRLDRGQHIVPAGHVERYTRHNTASWLGTDPWYIHQACEKGAPSCGFHFSWDKEGGGGVGADQYTLLDVTREISSAKFVWPMRAKYMDALWNKILEATNCFNNGGTTANPPCDCAMGLCHLMEGFWTYFPGCMEEFCDSGKRPWETPTCGGSMCDGKGPKVYCTTLKDMDEVISRLGRLKPYSEDRNGCCYPTTSMLYESSSTLVQCEARCVFSAATGVYRVNSTWTAHYRRRKDDCEDDDCPESNPDCCWEFDECEMSSVYSTGTELNCEQWLNPPSPPCGISYSENGCEDFEGEGSDWEHTHNSDQSQSEDVYPWPDAGGGDLIVYGDATLGGTVRGVRVFKRTFDIEVVTRNCSLCSEQGSPTAEVELWTTRDLEKESSFVVMYPLELEDETNGRFRWVSRGNPYPGVSSGVSGDIIEGRATLLSVSFPDDCPA